jgi:hypothetical protein
MRLRAHGLRVATLGLAVLLAACQTTRATKSVETRGFLGDYSQLREGEGDEAQLVFINRAADFGRYDAVIIDSVSFWQIGDNNVSPEDQQTLTDQLYLSLDTKLNEKGFATVREPGPNTLLLRAAITQAVGAKTVSNAVTSIMPQTRLLASLSGMAADTAVLVGQAAIEVDIRDSVSEERVAAAVDRRVGTKAIRAAFSEWKHVTEAFDYWAERIALVHRRDVELRAVLIPALVDVPPVADGSRHVPAGGGDEAAALPGLGRELDHLDVLHLGPGATLVGEHQAAARLQVDARQQVPADALGEHVVDLLLLAEVEGAIDVVEQAGNHLLRAAVGEPGALAEAEAGHHREHAEGGSQRGSAAPART